MVTRAFVLAIMKAFPLLYALIMLHFVMQCRALPPLPSHRASKADAVTDETSYILENSRLASDSVEHPDTPKMAHRK